MTAPPSTPPNEWQLRPEDSRTYHWDQLSAYDVEQQSAGLQGERAAEEGQCDTEVEEPEDLVEQSKVLERTARSESPLSWPSTPEKSVECCPEFPCA